MLLYLCVCSDFVINSQLHSQISPYMWRMATSGLNEFVAYSLKNPGRSLYECACQGSEGAIGNGKSFCSTLGTGKEDMPEKLGNYYDLSGVLMVYENQINVAQILRKLFHGRNLIFNGDETCAVERQIESRLPPFSAHIVKLCDGWEPGQAVPSLLNKIYARIELTPNAWKIDEIKEIMKNSCGKHISKLAFIDPQSEEYLQMQQELDSLNENPKTKNIFKFQKAKVVNQL